MILQDCLEEIKTQVEHAITTRGTAGKRSLITSQRLINLLHEVVKTSLISQSVNSTLIHPPIGK